MNFNFVPIEHKNPDDCWCIAISTALGIKYETVYRHLKPFMQKDKVPYAEAVISYIRARGYEYFSVDISLKDALRLYNLKNGVLFGMSNKEDEGHIAYIKGDKIYEYYGEEMLWWYIKEFTVTDILIKLEKYK